MKTQSNRFFNKNKLRNLRNETPFFVFSKEALLSNLEEYQSCLSTKTEICYAMKANSERCVLQTLNEVGISFEVASKYELALLKPLKVPPKRIIYGTAVKPTSHIKEFVKYGVDRFAFDTEDELFKIAKYAAGARVYIRVLVDDRSESVFHMSEKFGTQLENTVNLLLKAKELGLVSYGISFNVGSQAINEQAWARGIEDVAKIMKSLLKEGIKIQVVNLGGGFPHSYQDNDKIPGIKQISKHINVAINKLPYKIDYIAEPGRGLVADAFVLVTSVFGKNKRSNGHWLFVDAGVYNALLEAMAYQGSTRYRIVPLGDYSSNLKEHFIVTGPTGDNLDVIDKDAILPAGIQIGDKLVIYDTGGYTFTLMTRFNGFPKPKIINLF